MGPPILPTVGGVSLTASRVPITIELFLDLVCPFSCKMFKTLLHEVIPKLSAEQRSKLSIVVQQVPQPWHPHSSYVHEAALAVKDIAPDAFPAYVDALYSAYTAGKFQDESTWDKSRAQVYDELVKELPGGVDAAAVSAKLKLKEGGGGTHMTQALKWACKYHRGRGVHVTPTVHVNGLEAGMVSSGWSAEQWLKFIEPMGEDNWTGSKLA
jgi:hypothetical protein